MNKNFSEAAFNARIEELGLRMDKGFDELKTLFNSMENRLRSLEQTEAGAHPLIENRLDAAWRKLDEHETKLTNLTKAINETAQDTDMQKAAERMDKIERMTGDALLIAGRLESVAKWLLGIFTAIIIAILIAFLTGKATIVFH